MVLIRAYAGVQPQTATAGGISSGSIDHHDVQCEASLLVARPGAIRPLGSAQEVVRLVEAALLAAQVVQVVEAVAEVGINKKSAFTCSSPGDGGAIVRFNSSDSEQVFDMAVTWKCKGCDSDEDCGSGTACHPETDTCEDSCSNDGHCRGGQECQSGFCEDREGGQCVPETDDDFDEVVPLIMGGSQARTPDGDQAEQLEVHDYVRGAVLGG